MLVEALQQHRWLLVLLTFVLISGLEVLHPFARSPVALFPRWRDNFLLQVTNGALQIVCAPLVVYIFALSFEGLGTGLFELIPFSFWATVIIGILTLDFVTYWLHRAMHAVGWLWRIHKVHHAAREVDLTTGWCFHPLEAIIHLIVRIVLIGLLALPPEIVLIYLTIVQLANFVEHANIKVPIKWDRSFASLLITPAVHRVHHSVSPLEYNSNFGTIFSVWDRLFTSFSPGETVNTPGFSCGLAEFPQHESLGFLKLLRLPFQNLPLPKSK